MRSDYPTDWLRHIHLDLVSTATIVALFVLPMNAHALSCAPRIFTLSDAYDAADSIIVGLVTECEEEVSREPWANGGGGCSFVSLDVLKESNSVRDYRGVASSSGCGLSLQVGKQYLLFLDSENRPMHYSASLSGEQYSNQLSDSYQKILRELRDGVVSDLSEPWLFWEYEGSCTLSHIVGGHRIDLGGGRPGAHGRLFPNMTREKVDGKTVYRGQTRSVGANSSSLMLDVEVVVVGDIPEYPIDTQMLTVSFQEQTPAPVRQATITVGTRSWPLYRVEEYISISGMPAITQIEYRVGGDVSEQILSAMSKPSDVVVSAVLVNSPNVDSEPSPENSQFDQGSVIQTPQGDAYSSRAPPESGLANPQMAPRAYQSRKKPAEPVLRLETRSTQLPAVMESYEACYEKVER